MTFPKGTAVLKATAQFSGQTDPYFSSTWRFQVPPLVAPETQTLTGAG